MNITSEKLNSAEIKLKIEVSELEMQGFYEKAIEKLAGQVNIKGFRPGKVPLDVAKESLDPKAIEMRAIDLAIAPTYIEAVEKEKIEPIARPEINIISTNPLVYEAVIAVYPEVKLKDYKQIKLVRNNVELSDADLEEELKRFQQVHSTFTDVTRPAQVGDRTEVDFQGYDTAGAQLEGTTSKNHPIVIGDKMFIPGFEEAIIGMNINDEKEFQVTFPKDYFHKPFQGKDVKFKVKVNRIEQRNLPAIDAEFIKKVAGKEMSEADFRKELRVNMLKSRQQEEQSRLEGDLLEQLKAQTEVQLAHSLIDEEIHYMNEEQKKELENRGINWEQYLEAVKKTEKDLHDEKHHEAEDRLKLRFAVQELFKLEKIEVTEAELEAAFQDEMKILATMNYEPKIEEQKAFKNRLTSKLKMEKLLAVFIK